MTFSGTGAGLCGCWIWQLGLIRWLTRLCPCAGFCAGICTIWLNCFLRWVDVVAGTVAVVVKPGPLLLELDLFEFFFLSFELLEWLSNYNQCLALSAGAGFI